ncbi:hypothetical protein ES703_120981 [subsurface metagenome]
MIDIKYDYPHAFFLSVGIVTLIFGFYPFYITNWNFNLMHLSRIIIHAVLLIFSILCILKGLKLWKEKEEEKKEVAKITKERLKLSLELKKLSLQERKDKNQVDKLNQEIIKLLEKKEEERKKVEVEIKGKKSEIEKFNTEISKKRKEIDEKTSKLYELQEEEISKTPNSYLFASGATTTSGAISASRANLTPTISIPDTAQIYNYAQKKCSKCGEMYSPIWGMPDEGVCQMCRYNIYPY